MTGWHEWGWTQTRGATHIFFFFSFFSRPRFPFFSLLFHRVATTKPTHTHATHIHTSNVAVHTQTTYAGAVGGESNQGGKGAVPSAKKFEDFNF